MNTLNKVNIEWVSRLDQECLKFTFKGIFTRKVAQTTINQWKAYFNFHKDSQIVLIWDCSNLTGFESLAGVAWQKAMREMADQISSVFLISESKLICTGVSLMSMLTRFKIKPLSSEAEIDLECVMVSR